jgi:hypothetical protein
VRHGRRIAVALAALLCTTGIWLQASGDQAVASKPTVDARLDHALHEEAFGKVGLRCVDCHPVGMVDARGLPAPLAACHSCHLGQVQGTPRKATRRCEACHPHRRELEPATHRGAWLETHGPDARFPRSGCDDCHDRGQCIACHDARGALVRTPHPPGFRALHGPEARIDGVSCVGCHTSESCMSCHAQGRWPW